MAPTSTRAPPTTRQRLLLKTTRARLRPRRRTHADTRPEARVADELYRSLRTLTCPLDNQTHLRLLGEATGRSQQLEPCTTQMLARGLSISESSARLLASAMGEHGALAVLQALAARKRVRRPRRFVSGCMAEEGEDSKPSSKPCHTFTMGHVGSGWRGWPCSRKRINEAGIAH